MTLLLAFAALAVAALAAGPFLYRSLLPAPAATPAGCSFVAVTGSLFALLVGATVWRVRRRRRSAEPEPERRLWQATLGRDEKRRGDDG